MCGIVGLLLKKAELRERLGEWMVPMLIGMTERGPESTGLAIFSDADGRGRYKYNLNSSADSIEWADFRAAARRDFGNDSEVQVTANHAVLETAKEPAAVRDWLHTHFASIHVLSSGRSMDVYKDTGTPAEVADRYHFERLRGTHLIAHTRMATESAVTPAHAHPFTSGEDFCLVHNGTISNPNSTRRKLRKLGFSFDTDNDTEVACRYLDWRMQEGDDLPVAIEKGFDEFDGFYTFLIGTSDKLALVRDAFACKPAVVAETDDYVAIASEFRSLARLPGVKNAKIFEPKPEEIYVWQVQ